HLIVEGEWPRYRNGITAEEAEALLGTDLAPFVRAVDRNVTTALAQHQFDALIVLAYNIGAGAFANSSVVRLINDPSACTPYPSLEAAWK
ncbi:lysozyme, partial [Escherichia coli]|uniref:lysozyme n=1 Tax=Escherichia coli TaxID=562 RepID=UPI0028DDB20C